MEIIPKSLEYHFEACNHKMTIMVDHEDKGRNIGFFFDEKLISRKMEPKGHYTEDDDCIEEIVETYCKNNKGVFSDLIKNHSDKIRLTDKVREVVINSNGVLIDTTIHERYGEYKISMSGHKGEDKLNCSFKANDFSEALEKFRYFMSTLEEVKEDLVSNIDELSDDKVEKWIKW